MNLKMDVIFRDTRKEPTQQAQQTKDNLESQNP